MSGMASFIKVLKRSGPQASRLLEELAETGKLTGEGLGRVGKAGLGAGSEAVRLGGKKMGARLREAASLSGEGMGQVLGAGGGAAKDSLRRNPYGAALLGGGAAAGAGGLGSLAYLLGDDDDDE